MKPRQLVYGLVALMLVAAACGGGEEEVTPEEEATPEQEVTPEEEATPEEIIELTAVIPFPSGVAFYPPFVAEARGYLAEEGISLTVEVVDGSGQVLQQLLAGQADIGFPSPGPFMNATNEGADIVSVYTLYQKNVFAISTLADSDIQEIGDVAGTTVGVGTIEGGETPLVRAVLSEEGLEEDADYELLAVGDGGTAAVALDRGDVSAYGASFVDVAIMKLQGLELRDLLPEGFVNFFDSLVVLERSFVDENPEVIEGLGRALARATVWGLENPEGVIDITSQSFPEEAEDRDFTLAILLETQKLYELPAEAEGQWGTAVPEFVDTYMGFLVEQGEIEEPVDPGVFVNDFVPGYNDFDPAEL